MTIPFLSVAGTWAYKNRFDLDAWWQPTSAFTKMLKMRDFKPISPLPFLWSTDVNGEEGWRRWLSWLPFVDRVGDQRDWEVTGYWITRWCEKVKDTPFVLFCHSHGGQPAKFAAFHGFYIPVLVTIATPVRRLEAEISPGVCVDIFPAFRKNIGYWIHLHSGFDDKMQWLGQLGDGIVRGNRSEPYADLNIVVPSNRHSRILHANDEMMQLWLTQGWLEAVRKAVQ